MPTAARRLEPIAIALAGLFGLFVLLGVAVGRSPLASAVVLGAFSTVSTTLLGVLVWRLCRRWPWPPAPTPRFYLAHVGLALASALIWPGVVRLLYSLWSGSFVFLTLGDPHLVAWQLLTGVWIYGVLAGVSYAILERRQLQREARARARAEAAAADARLDAIRARLHPHFLLNALHSVGALVRRQPAQAEVAIDRLGELLRHVLREDGRPLVELAEEVGFARRYLELEAIRYQERLRYDIRVDPACDELELPPFAVQTLVENAVRHAVAPRPDGGTIAIVGECVADRLRVTVRDDGPGDREGDDGPRDREGVDDAGAPSAHGFGLRALRARLREAFGARAELRIRRGPDGFEVQLEVPAAELGADEARR
jgi:signal transduction histidine kinase